jgi:hypothetical protein
MAALEELQDNRKREVQARLDKAAWQYIDAVYEDRQEEFEPAELGFEFSFEQIEARTMQLDKNLFAGYEQALAEKRCGSRKN